MAVLRAGSRRPALRSDETIALQLVCELLESSRLKARENQGRFDGLQRRTGGEYRTRRCSGGNSELLHGNFGCCRRRRIQNVLNRSHSGNRFLGEDAKLQRKRSGKLAVQIDRAAAHSSDDARVLNLRPFELDEDDGLLRAKKVVQDPDDFQVELLNLVPRKNRVRIP